MTVAITLMLAAAHEDKRLQWPLEVTNGADLSLIVPSLHCFSVNMFTQRFDEDRFRGCRVDRAGFRGVSGVDSSCPGVTSSTTQMRPRSQQGEYDKWQEWQKPDST